MISANLTAFEKTLLKIDNVCRKNNLAYIIIGGIAVMQYLKYRTTRDIDISLALDISSVREVGQLFLQDFRPVYDDPLDFFEKYFVLPLNDPDSGIHVDVSAGLGGFEQLAVGRGKRVKFASLEIPLCSVEDLIIFKLVAARPTDLADVELLIEKYCLVMDIPYLTNMAKEFTHLERSDILNRIDILLNKYIGRNPKN
ncbi:hypothetical protein JW964_09635 [candidate division KSB1 bacterium]|nr:hypothetical protein [candidate division KSB1 bacterium]